MKPRLILPILAAFSLILASAFVPSTRAQTEPTREETLKIAIPGRIEDPTNFNITSWSVSRSDTGLHQVAYEYFFYDNLQTGEYIPWLAESYEYNADFTAIDVKLREGITWNDGEPFKVEDVIFTYDTMRDNPTMAWAEEANKRVESVEKVDDLTVRFNLFEANPRFHRNREAFPAVGIWGGITILPQHVWEGEDPLTFKNNPPVSTGPYRLMDASQNAITWERRDDWWGTEVFGVTPGPSYIQFVHLGEETNVAFALSNDEIDTASIGILSAGSFEEVASRNPNVRAWYGDSPFAWSDPCPRALMVQNATPPLDNPQVRWAISAAIDRQMVVDLAYEGTTVPAWGIWPEYDANTPYFDAISDLREQYPVDAYDPARTEELLAEAGVSASDITLRYVVQSDSNEEMRVSQVIADQLTAAGFNVELQPLAGSVLSDTLLRGDYDLKLHSFCPGYIVENLELFHSKFYQPLGEPAPWFERNSFRYQNPELDAIVDQMFQLPADDEAGLVALYQEAMAIWFADLPVVPIVQAPALVPYSSTYWTGWPTADDPWNMPVSWWATFNLVVNGYPGASEGEWVGGIQAAGAGS